MNFRQFFQWGTAFLFTFFLFFSLYYYLIRETINIPYSNLKINTGITDFTLTDQNGAERSISEFRGKSILIYFGYTSCNSICHTILQNISHALKMIGNDSDKIVPIFVTINPERDTVDTLKSYSINFHHNFIMMTGTAEQIAVVLRNYKVYRKIKSDERMLDPFIEHSNLVYLLDQDGLLVKSFDQNLSTESLVGEINIFINKK